MVEHSKLENGIMFKIQISNPVILKGKIENENITLDEAIESVFPLDSEYLILIWNHIFIPLTYKYDVSCILSDFILILKFIENDKENNLEINWPSNTFSANWRLKKSNGEIYIESEWITVIGGTEDLLNKSNENIVKVEEFKEEIKKLLSFIKNALKQYFINYSKIEGIEWG